MVSKDRRHLFVTLAILESDPHSSSFLFTISPSLLYPLHVISFFLHNYVTSSLAVLLLCHPLFFLSRLFFTFSVFRYLPHLLFSKRHLFTLYSYLSFLSFSQILINHSMQYIVHFFRLFNSSPLRLPSILMEILCHSS